MLLFPLAKVIVTNSSLDKEGLRRFLESQFVPEAGLLRAATYVFPDNITCWIASDNLLASRALEVLESPYAQVLLTKLAKYNYGKNNQHEILLGIDIPDTFYEPCIEVITTIYSKKYNASIIIKSEIHNESNSIINDWILYADLIVYRALDALLSNDLYYAEKLFEKLMTMWDGYGFKDKAFDDKYATYKLALAIYLYRALQASGSKIISNYRKVIDKCYEVIQLMQRDDGGIITNYKVEHNRIIPIGDANTETTSIVVLAIYSNYPLIIGKNVKHSNIINTYSFISLIISIALIAILLYILTYTKSLAKRLSRYSLFNFFKST